MLLLEIYEFIYICYSHTPTIFIYSPTLQFPLLILSYLPFHLLLPLPRTHSTTNHTTTAY